MIKGQEVKSVFDRKIEKSNGFLKFYVEYSRNFQQLVEDFGNTGWRYHISIIVKY